jgi:hypothetical protein
MCKYILYLHQAEAALSALDVYCGVDGLAGPGHPRKLAASQPGNLLPERLSCQRKAGGALDFSEGGAFEIYRPPNSERATKIFFYAERAKAKSKFAGPKFGLSQSRFAGGAVPLAAGSGSIIPAWGESS